MVRKELSAFALRCAATYALITPQHALASMYTPCSSCTVVCNVVRLIFEPLRRRDAGTPMLKRLHVTRQGMQRMAKPAPDKLAT